MTSEYLCKVLSWISVITLLRLMQIDPRPGSLPPTQLLNVKNLKKTDEMTSLILLKVTSEVMPCQLQLIINSTAT